MDKNLESIINKNICTNYPIIDREEFITLEKYCANCWMYDAYSEVHGFCDDKEEFVRANGYCCKWIKNKNC